MMDCVQKHNTCITVPSSETFRSYQNEIVVINDNLAIVVMTVKEVDQTLRRSTQVLKLQNIQISDSQLYHFPIQFFEQTYKTKSYPNEMHSVA
jgi:hypothetical protein